MDDDLPPLWKRLVFLALFLGGAWLLLMGFIWLVSKAPEYPPKALDRGGTLTATVSFNGPALDAKGASIFVPEKTFLNRNWEGCRFAVKDEEKGIFEIILDGQTEGLELSVGKVAVKGPVGVGEIHVTASATTPPGRYRIWLKGVYKDITQITTAPRLIVLHTNSELKGVEIPTVVIDVQ